MNQNTGDSNLITIIASAFDTDGAIVRVEYYADGNLIGTSTSNPYAILWTGMQSNRTYTLTAKAFDNAGATTVSAPVTITVGNPSANLKTRFDFDGDGKAEIAVFRPTNGTWYFHNLATNQFNSVQFGQAGDKPVAADYDGDGKSDVAVFRNGIWYLQRSQAGFTGVQFGESTDKPVPADYDGDGKADIAVFRAGIWYLQRSAAGFTGVQFGLGTDMPTPADYDGDGKTDIAVFRQGIWYLLGSQAGLSSVAFGASDDRPVPDAFVP